MFNRFMRWLVPKLEAWCRRTGRVLNIHGTDAPEDVYLVRYFLFRSKLFSIYIHRFLRSDRDDHHDHPFDFLGYVVSGGYNESLMRGEVGGLICINAKFSVGRRNPGTWAWRKAETIHMVQLDKEYKPDQYLEAPLTIIFRGPYRRQWGFWKHLFDNDYVWVLWREYLGVPESDIRE